VKEETKTGGTEKYSDSTFNFGTSLSWDFRHLIRFPLGMDFEYLRENKDNTFGLGVYYQGIGDIQLGLFASVQKYSKIDMKQKVGLFDITYFF
jgi:hypothetical protein